MSADRVTVEQAAAQLGVAPAVVERLVSDGLLTPQGQGPPLQFDVAELARLRRTLTHRMWRAVRELAEPSPSG